VRHRHSVPTGPRIPGAVRRRAPRAARQIRRGRRPTARSSRG
jgi:hypothetical protein